MTLNGKAISKDTEPEVFLSPRCYWRLVLQARLEELLQDKFPGNRSVRSDDTTAVVSVTERSQRDLTKWKCYCNLSGFMLHNLKLGSQIVEPLSHVVNTVHGDQPQVSGRPLLSFHNLLSEETCLPVDSRPRRPL